MLNVSDKRFHTCDFSMNYRHNVTQSPTKEAFSLHSHDGFEVLIFIKGNMQFVVEGTQYPLSPYDTMILRNDEMHDIYPTGGANYERIVIHFSHSFFKENHCEQYEAIFKNRPLGKNNRISGKLVSASDVMEIISRLEKYGKENTVSNDTVIKCAFIELLHALNNIEPDFDAEEKQHNVVQKVIDYINLNLDGDLTLDTLSSMFFVSKYHLCRVFRINTGYTINNYITNKRLLLVRELCRKGESISTACVSAGFSGYSSFYKAYTKAYGSMPKSGLK